MTLSFTYYQDPGHGWLRVPMSLIKKIGIESKISSYSFISGKSSYLEEDDDACIFLQRLRELKIDFVIKNKYIKRFDRSKTRFNTNTI